MAIPAGPTPNPPLGSPAHLLKSLPGVVRRRDGGVLARGFILKTDHYPTGRAMDLDINLIGAPNFRGLSNKGSNYNVYGVAQPTVPGLKTILSILQSSPQTSSQQTTVSLSTREEPILYISGRPFVLRDSSSPLRTLPYGGSAQTLEGVENRLKKDVLKEAVKYGGMILTHQETADREGEVLPVWIQVDEAGVQTAKEIYEDFNKQGWKVDYHRIPISPERPIEDNYLDAYLGVLQGLDPMNSSVVINCGMGVVRTTFAMTAAVLIRRHQMLRLGHADDFAVQPSGTFTPSNGKKTPTLMSPTHSSSGTIPTISTVSNPVSQAGRIIESAAAQHALNRSLLKLTRMLDSALINRRNGSAADLLSERPALLDSLRSAHMGSYQVILSLLGCLEGGRGVKNLVDSVIDACDAVTNLREEIIEYRIKASLELEDRMRQTMLDKASQALEKYFFMISFAAFIEDSDGLNGKFAHWLRNRSEIWNQIMFLRKGHKTGSRLFIFAPVTDLSIVSRASNRNPEPDGGKLMEIEWAEHVVAQRSGIILRAGTLLKSDQWFSQTANSANDWIIRGAAGFRNIPGSNIYAVGQPTEDAVDKVLSSIKERTPNVKSLLWVNLREEPLVYINGHPFCLRKESLSLRNMKDYSGVSASRLEALEDRLKSDVETELKVFEGSLLLHSETSDGSVVPVWDDCDEGSIASVREIMEEKDHSQSQLQLTFKRLPLTSEQPLDFADISTLTQLVLRTDLEETAIVLNDQLGRGRSTISSVIILLTKEWLEKHRANSSSDGHNLDVPQAEEEDAVVQGESIVRRSRPIRQHSPRGRTTSRAASVLPTNKASKAMSWQVINSLLRVVRNGLEVKLAVDEAIDKAGQNINLRDCIEDARSKATEATSAELRNKYTQQGVYHLRRYFQLVLYQAYLEETHPDTFEQLESFESFVSKRPVFSTFEKELKEGGLESLAPVTRLVPADGLATSDEVQTAVANRTGIILSALTILKSDFFKNLQKLSLPERVEGAANYRRVPLTLAFAPPADGGEQTKKLTGWLDDGLHAVGTGMPSIDGLRNALYKMDAGPKGSQVVAWTSLREEPVIYVAGRPHVLRLESRPLTNVEATGITTDVVESMEVSLKKDVVDEIRRSQDGRILLHDEVEDGQGGFEIVPIWETVKKEDVMTPKDVYEQVRREGFMVNYARVAITDEQAPLPAALDALVHRVIDSLTVRSDMVFNCQMGRGRTTTGMVAACLISSVVNGDRALAEKDSRSSESRQTDPYLNGEYKMILSLVAFLQWGPQAKALADRAIDQMDGVQNLRKAVMDYKLKAETTPPGVKQAKLFELGCNYLYRYGMLVVLAGFLIEHRTELRKMVTQKSGHVMFDEEISFPKWLCEHKEITSTLARRSLA
ncbi:hypothetical protein [Phaffia rhodozyma]|uniref:Inositol hexakisphosphate-domain-containing protein n=1 Tax=Phaffia rhodozyma TaxID=264483 RepID=A0A0F7SLK0_PHARH|nr:hypothetical protein [Phaffia rhodozyma]